MLIDGYGIYTWFGFALPLPEKLRLIRQAGFDTVGLWWGDTFSRWDGSRESQAEAARHAGLRVENGHLPYFGCNALWEDKLAGQQLLEDYIGAIDAAAGRVKTLILHPFDKDPPPIPPELFLTRLRILGERCARRQIRLALENLNERDCLCRLLDLCAENPWIGLCFDAGHNNTLSPAGFLLLHTYPGRLFALHLHDNDGAKDQHLLPGEGSVDWRGFRAALQKTSYCGPLLLEAACPSAPPAYVPAESPAGYLARAYAACSQII